MAKFGACIALACALVVTESQAATLIDAPFDTEMHTPYDLQINGTADFQIENQVNFVSASDTLPCHSGTNCLQLVGTSTDYIFGSGALFSKRVYDFRAGDEVIFSFFGRTAPGNILDGFGDFGFYFSSPTLIMKSLLPWMDDWLDGVGTPSGMFAGVSLADSYTYQRYGFVAGSDGQFRLNLRSFFNGTDSMLVDDIKVIVTPAVIRPVPEPSTWMTMLAGFAGIGLCLRKMRREGQVIRSLS
jgi:hypothetical protein